MATRFPSKRWDSDLVFEVQPSCCNSTMSDAYASVHIPKSLPIHGMALTSTDTDRKIKHNKVVYGTLTYESNGSVSLKILGFSCLRGVAVSRLVVTPP